MNTYPFLANQPLSAAALNAAIADPPIVSPSPVSGGTITMADTDRSLYVDNAATLAALTIKLPAIAEGQIELGFRAPVTALTIQDAAGLPVAGAPTNAFGPGAAICMRRVAANRWVYWK